MKYKDVKYVCFVDSAYSLLLYILLYGKVQFESTFFFASDAISKSICGKIKFYKFLSKRKLSSSPLAIRVLSRFILSRISYLRWPFLKTVPIYGADHLWFTPALLKKRSMTVLEDGLTNYSYKAMTQTLSLKHHSLYKWIAGTFMCEGEFGYSSQVHKVILTGKFAIPDCIKNKTELVDLLDLWTRADKEFIQNLFDLTYDDVCMIKSKRIMVLTQPYEEMIGTEELLKIYRRIVNLFKSEEVLIKTHPRDTIDYAGAFPNITVYSKKIPVELFVLLGINFTDVYTITSASIYSFPDSVKKHFLGTECHPLLMKKCGKMTMENCCGV